LLLQPLDCKPPTGARRRGFHFGLDGTQGPVHAALAEKERSLIARWTRDALKAAKARGVVLGNPNLADVRNRAVASTMAELIALLRTLPRLSVKFSRAAWPRIVASRDRSMLAALRRHAVANGRRSRSAPSCSGSLPEMAND